MRQRNHPAALTQAAERKRQRLPSPSGDEQPMLRLACQSSGRFKSCGWTYRRRASVSGQMDEQEQIDQETRRLIDELLTRLGALMEDTSTTALLHDSCGGSLQERVNLLGVEIARMKSIRAAAEALLND